MLYSVRTFFAISKVESSPTVGPEEMTDVSSTIPVLVTGTSDSTKEMNAPALAA